MKAEEERLASRIRRIKQRKEEESKALLKLVRAIRNKNPQPIDESTQNQHI